jgi:hypothetical protein
MGLNAQSSYLQVLDVSMSSIESILCVRHAWRLESSLAELFFVLSLQ